MRRWDKQGIFPSVRRSGGNRYYTTKGIEDYFKKNYSKDLRLLATNWVSGGLNIELPSVFYCSNSSVFQTRLMKMEKTLSIVSDIKNIYPLIVAVAGEIGNNSFDHNIGNWPDTPGIFFAYNIEKREIVLADRGQGVLETLKRVKTDLKNDKEALETAFTEIVSGRAPESRGNGLKFVKKVVINDDYDFKFSFRSGDAEVSLKKGDLDLNITTINTSLRGCIAKIQF